MAISYNKLWKLLVDKKMSKADLRKAAGIAPNTMTRLRRDEEVTLAVLNKICTTLEVDIGDICHDMSPLADLNKMANEVVRTIIDRAVEYGRVTMMDKLGNYIRMAIMGLSLIILGLFMIFFVP